MARGVTRKEFAELLAAHGRKPDEIKKLAKGYFSESDDCQASIAQLTEKEIVSLVEVGYRRNLTVVPGRARARIASFRATNITP
jgi:hypothetical protein